MSIIFGVLDKTGTGFDSTWLSMMKKELLHGKPDQTGMWDNQKAGLGNLLVFNTPESLHETLPFYHREPKLVISSDARIDNRENLAVRLDIAMPDLKTMPDSRLILIAYQKWGDGCTDYFRGDFSFAIYDEQKHSLFLTRDHFGMKPLFYFDHPKYFVFSSEISGIIALPFFKKTLNEQWLADFLINTNRNELDTFYEGIYAIPPGHQLRVDGKNVSIKKYWELTVPEKIILKNDHEYIEAYKELFVNSVEARSRSAFPVGAELSGGLDSSSITTIAQKFLASNNSALHVFARVLPQIKNPKPAEKGDDESAEIKMVCDYCGIKNVHRVTMHDQEITKNINQITQMLKSPYNHNYAAYNLNAHQQAENAQVRTILSGHGGDQMVTNAGFFVYQDYLRQSRYLKFFHDLRAKNTNYEIGLITALKQMYKLSRKKPDFTKKRKEIKGFYKFGLDESLIQKYSLKDRYLKSRETAVYSPAGLSDLVSKITHRNMNDRIEISSILAGHQNIEFRYPLFDVDLILFYLSTPDEMKRKFRQGRYIHRMAMQDELPTQIQWRKDKHGTINPGLESIFTNDAHKIKNEFSNLLLNSTKNKALVFDAKWIEKIIYTDDVHLYDHKSVINKFFQLQNFIQIIENKFV